MDTKELLPFDIGRGFSRLNTIATVLNNIAEREYNVLRIGASVTNADYFNIGTDRYVVDEITTTTGQETAGGDGDSATGNLLLTFSSAPSVGIGDLVAMGTELCRVIGTDGATYILVSRGACGTTAAAHIDGVTIYQSATPGTIITAGYIPLGVLGLTAAAVSAAITAMLNVDKVGTETNSGTVSCIEIDSATLLVVDRTRATFQSPSGLATTSHFTSGSNAWDHTAMVAASRPARRRFATGARVPIAAEVTYGSLFIPVDFTPASAIVQVVATSGGTPVAWNGGITLVAPGDSLENKPGYVVLDNTGNTDWATTDTIYFLIGE